MALLSACVVLCLATSAVPAMAAESAAEPGSAVGIDPESAAAAGPGAAAGVEAAPQSPVEPTEKAYESTVRSRRPLARDGAASVQTVEGEQLRQSTRPSTFEALAQESAGVYVSGKGVGPHGVANGATGSIQMRGLGGGPNTQVLVVEDGVPDYQGIFGHPLPDAYSSVLIDEAALVPGGDSVLYGTNALGGAILLRSRWLERDGLELVNDASAGSFSTLSERLTALGRSGPLDAAASFNALRTEGHRDGAGGASDVLQLAGRYRGEGGLRVFVRSKTLRLTGADPGPASHPLADHWYDVWRQLLSAGLEGRRGLVRLRLTPHLNLGLHRLYDGFYSRDLVGGAIAEAEATLAPALALLVGAAFERVDGRIEDRASGERRAVEPRHSGALYQQLTLRPHDTLAAVAGARALLTTTSGPVLLYKAGVRWTPGAGASLHARLARNYREPTLRELYLPFPTANPELRPEYALNAELGAGWTRGRLSLEASLYRTAARDLIRYFGAWPTAEVVNIDQVLVWGVEGRAALERLGPLSLQLSGDWREVGRWTRQNPEAKLDFALRAEQGLGAHRLFASLSGEWVHGLYMGNYGRDPLADVFFLDATVRLQLSHGEDLLEPYLTLRNLLNARYQYLEDYPMPPFNLSLGLAVRLG